MTRLDTPLAPNTKVAPPLKAGDTFIFLAGTEEAKVFAQSIHDWLFHERQAVLRRNLVHQCGAVECVVVKGGGK